MSSRFDYVVAFQSLLPFSRLHTIDHILFICSSTNGHMGGLHFLATMNDSDVVMSVQVYVWVPAFNSLGCIPRREIAGSYGNSVFNFWGTPRLFSTVATPCDIHTSSAQRLTILKFKYCCRWNLLGSSFLKTYLVISLQSIKGKLKCLS